MLVKEKDIQNNKRKFIYKSILIFSHNKGGGTDRCVKDMAINWKEKGIRVFIARPLGNFIRVNCNFDENITFEFKVPENYREFLDFCLYLNIGIIHYHHFIGYNDYIMNMPQDLKCPYSVTLHDYFVICPQINLTNDDVYCNEPGDLLCNECLAKKNQFKVKSINEWRKYWHTFLKNAIKITVPSCDVKKRLSVYFPDLKIYIVENIETHLPLELYYSCPKPPSILKIVILGSISKIKGADFLYECANYSQKYDLPISYKVIGSIYNKRKGVFNNKLYISGAYSDYLLRNILEREDIDLFFFPGKIPETFSYTLSWAILSKVPCVAFDIGAIAERIKKYDIGWCLSLQSEPVEVNNFFLKLMNSWDEYVLKKNNLENVKLKNNYNLSEFYSNKLKKHEYFNSCSQDVFDKYEQFKIKRGKLEAVFYPKIVKMKNFKLCRFIVNRLNEKHKNILKRILYK